MICKSVLNDKYYDYKFIEGGIVELTRPDMEHPLLVKYGDWCLDYFIIDKWRNIDGKVYS